MSGNEQQSPPHFQYPHEHGRAYHAPSLPSLAAAASSLSLSSPSLPPPRLPQLPARTRTVRSPQSSSAGSSPATSPATTTTVGPSSSSSGSSMKRPMRAEHDRHASTAVYPSMMQLALASSSVSALADDNGDVKREVDAPATAANAVAKARKRRAVESDDDVFISGAYKAQRKPAPNATHELRGLRQDAAHMEYQIQALRSHWRSALPDDHVLLRACEAAKSKWITSQAEELNRQLKDQLLQQQLYLASLQNLVLQSPFFADSRSKDVFDALHSYTQLEAGLSTQQRREQLQAHCTLSARMAPSIVQRFVQPHVAKATVESPFAHASVMCDGDFTFVSNILACRIPHASLRAVADATAVYFTTLQREMQDHVGLAAEFRFIDELSDSSHYAQIRYQNGPELVSVLNSTFATHVRADSAVFVTDFVDDDAAFPPRTPGDGTTMRDTCLALVLTPATDPHSGAPQVLLQRVTAARYNLPPSSRLVHHDLKTTQQWLNGDLLLKVICQQLEAQQQSTT